MKIRVSIQQMWNCRKALKFLAAKGIDFIAVPIRDTTAPDDLERMSSVMAAKSASCSNIARGLSFRGQECPVFQQRQSRPRQIACFIEKIDSAWRMPALAYTCAVARVMRQLDSETWHRCAGGWRSRLLRSRLTPIQFVCLATRLKIHDQTHADLTGTSEHIRKTLPQASTKQLDRQRSGRCRRVWLAIPALSSGRARGHGEEGQESAHHRRFHADAGAFMTRNANQRSLKVSSIPPASGGHRETRSATGFLAAIGQAVRRDWRESR